MEFVAEQIENAGIITYRAMFGEYGIYADGKIFGLIYDIKLFILPTNAGRAFIKNVVKVPTSPMAKSSFLIEKKIEDREWLNKLVKIIVKELPEPRPKRKEKK